MRKKYETDLTDSQWAEIEPLFVGTQMGKKRVGKCGTVLGKNRLSVEKFAPRFPAGFYCA